MRLTLLLLLLACAAPQPERPQPMVCHRLQACQPDEINTCWGCVQMEEFCYIHWCKEKR